jgi:long-chain acyl-CoA synthetase
MLAKGISRNDRVGLRAADGPQAVAALFGILRAGAVVVPVDTTYSNEMALDLASSLDLDGWVVDRAHTSLSSDLPVIRLAGEDSSATAVVSQTASPWPADDRNRVAEIVLTSGTTGDPRKVMVTHANLRTVLDGLESEIRTYRWPIRMSPTLHIAVALPLSHLYGQVMGAFLPVLLSANVSFIESLPPAQLASAMRRHSTWVLSTVPHTLSRLGDHLLEIGADIWGAAEMEQRLEDARGLPWPRRWVLFDRLRRRFGRRFIAVVSGGAELDPATEDLWRRLGYLVVQGYGLTEAAPLVALNHPLRPSAGSVGKPLPGIEIRLAESGEILVRGGNVTTGNDSSSRVDADGWLHTGDLGEVDETGSVRFVGRGNDRIVTPAGLNIDVEAVAAQLRCDPGVVDAVVLESPWTDGSSVCAVLAMRPGADPGRAVRSANRRLPDAARLRRWLVWPETDLPRTRTGKARRGPIREWLRSQASLAVSTDSACPPVTSTEEFLRDRVATLAGHDRTQIASNVPLSELLDSLQRVELASSLEQSLGRTPESDLFTGDVTIAQLADSHSPGAVTREPRRPPAQSRDVNAVPPSADWRFWAATRATRWLLREVVVRPALSACIRVTATGLENLLAVRAPFLVACNHVSILDPLVLLLALPRGLRHRLAPAAMWQHFVEHPKGASHYRWGVLGLNLFPLVQIGDWRPSLEIAGRLADQLCCPLIYPEGRRSEDGMPVEFQVGVAVLSAELKLPIVPCATAGLHAVMPIGRNWPRRRGIRRPTVAVCFGELIPVPGPDTDRTSTLEALRDRVSKLHQQAVTISGGL